MNYSLAQIILVAGNSDGEDAIWMQMLVLVVLAVLLAIGSLIKTRVNKFKDHQQYYPEYARSPHTQRRRQIKPLKELKDKCLGIFLKTAQTKAVVEEPVFDFDARDITGRQKPKNELVKEKGKDLHSGMEILELDFLLSVIENTKGDDKSDVTMRKLNFSELLRRGEQNRIDSNALTVYAVNQGDLYGKVIQFEAMKELAKITAHKIKHKC